MESKTAEKEKLFRNTLMPYHHFLGKVGHPIGNSKKSQNKEKAKYSVPFLFCSLILSLQVTFSQWCIRLPHLNLTAYQVDQEYAFSSTVKYRLKVILRVEIDSFDFRNSISPGYVKVGLTKWTSFNVLWEFHWVTTTEIVLQFPM